jgi:hypothetical protein
VKSEGRVKIPVNQRNERDKKIYLAPFPSPSSTGGLPSRFGEEELMSHERQFMLFLFTTKYTRIAKTKNRKKIK